MNGICGSVVSEGGGPLSDIPGRTFAAANSAGVGVTTRRPILSIQALKTFNTIANNAIILPNTISVFCNQQPVFIEIVRNATSLTGASWSSVDSNSTAQFDTSASTISGGSVVFSTLIASSSAFQLPLSANLLNRLIVTYSQLLNASDTLSLVCTSTAGASTTYGGITWKEIR